MRRLLRLAPVAAALFLASLAWAATPTWTSCADSHGSGSAAAAFGAANRSLCYDDSATDDSPILGTDACDNYDVFFDPDMGGTSTGATVQIMVCPGAGTPAAGDCYAAQNVTLDGDVSTNTDAIFGMAGGAPIYVHPTANPTGDPFRVRIHCNP